MGSGQLGTPGRRAGLRATALARRRELRALAAIARRERIACWIVGGTPRDLLLGRREEDVDVAVSGRAELLGAGLAARGFGTAVTLSDAPRVVRVAGARIVDLGELEGDSIETDLARRDFTANAIAIDLATGRWIDPFGGARDVRQKRLRLVRVENFARDPLRTLRAARLYATHGLLPDRAVARAASEFAPGLASVARERVAVELARMLEADRVGPAFRWGLRVQVISPALRIEAPAPAWRRAARTLDRLDSLSIRKLPPERRRRLRLAAIAASLRLGPGDLASWLRAARQSRAESAAVARLSRLAARVGRLLPGPSDWDWIRDAGADMADALLLTGALEPRRRGGSERLRRLGARRGPVPRVSGSDVLAWLGGPPGPWVGALLEALETAGLSGVVGNRREARRWLLAQGAARRTALAEDGRRTK